MQEYKKAVILLNMGGPNSLDEVSSFLKNMFADPCILSVQNGVFRSMIGSMIVNSRVEKSKKIYKQIGGLSPITSITFSLIQKLQARNQDTFYTYAMRYVPPFSYHVLEEIMQKGIQEIYLFSMYPQYSSTTTFSSFQDVAQSLKKLEFTPEIHTIDRYYNHHLFIDSILNSVQTHIMGKDSKDFILILSAHSIPLSRVKKGDPYQNECEECYHLIKKGLESRNLFFKDIILSYQSKVGPVKWIGPYTDEIIKQYAKNNNIIIFPLSFSIDNSETRYELDIFYRNLATSLDVKEYIVCPCLNDSEDFITLIESLII
ncbi:ferrochelatase [Helicobacter didelphidarum]|uniref:Ferrochelatase n=1 Tax=Helicobacter didelphidarum TaxID=2040648 RepID=A0A3D8II28_9HELI|nr:ferrochelatase [Helicobacter didelphidarum]RDU64997.1 ferrochelatase [Helicobacter didelphidarum]